MRSRCRGPRISSQSRHSARSVSIQRSAKAFAFGALIGVRVTRIPSDTQTSSKERENLASRSRMRKPICVPSSARLIARFLACWVTKEESGLVVETVTCTRRVPVGQGTRLRGSHPLVQHVGAAAFVEDGIPMNEWPKPIDAVVEAHDA